MNDAGLTTPTELIGPPVPIAAGLAAAAGPGIAVRLAGLEVVQAVQDLAHSVRLVADKATVVRAYVVSVTPLAAPVVVTGELTWRRGLASPPAYLPAMNTVTLNGAGAGIVEMRHNMNLSLNFRLPDAAVGAGPLQLRLHRVTQLGAGDAQIQPAPALDVRFDAGAPLRVRIIGLRYVDDEQVRHSPDAVHFQFVRSWLGRAYPTSRIEWSQIVVDANFAPPFEPSTELKLGTAALANAQIAALRAVDVATGTDPRTHYYGLVSDADRRHFMRGLAFAIPGTADPSVVASGPAGAGDGFAGDHDRSYADWYTGHELGHTFGRYHPGFPHGRQDASDPHFPYPGGRISTDDDRFVGFDLGDTVLGLSMQALPGRQWHDVMTYGPNQWLSPYTYEAIYQRLLEEESLGS